MKRGWLGLLPALLALALYAGGVGAQNGGETGDNSTKGGETGAPAAPATGGLAAGAHPFTISLPSGGTVLTPASADWPWPGMPSAAYHWYGSGPAKEVIVHCHQFQAPVTNATFNEFRSALQNNFSILDEAKEAERAESKTAKIEDAMGVEVKKSFVLGDPTTAGAGKVNAPYDAPDGSRWNLLAVKDQRNEEGQPVGYAIYSTFGGNYIYSVTVIHTGDLTAEIKTIGEGICNSLRDPLVTQPFGIEPVPGVPADAARAANVPAPAATAKKAEG